MRCIGQLWTYHSKWRRWDLPRAVGLQGQHPWPLPLYSETTRGLLVLRSSIAERSAFPRCVFLMWVFFVSLAVSRLSRDNKRDKRDQLPSALVGAHGRQVALAALPFLTRHSWMPAVFSELEERAERDGINSLCSSGFHIVGVLVALHQVFNVLIMTMLSSGLLP